MNLWEILVPTQFEDTRKPVSKRHHKEWDKYVRKLAGGLTILRPAKGQWVYQGKVYEDRVIPVRVACDERIMEKVALFTKNHYRQIQVMYYKISNETFFV